MEIVNLTPHTLSFMVKTSDGSELTLVIPPSGTIARCAVVREQVGTVIVDGVSIPINHTRFGVVEGLPDPEPDTVYVVSALVAQAVSERKDVYIVDDAVRDEQGRIVGARALAHI